MKRLKLPTAKQALIALVASFLVYKGIPIAAVDSFITTTSTVMGPSVK